MGGGMLPRGGGLARLQATLTNILVLIHKPVPILVDVFQGFLGSKGEIEKARWRHALSKSENFTYCPLSGFYG